MQDPPSKSAKPPTALYFTGNLPTENIKGFWMLLMWLKREQIFIPKDIRKLLLTAIKIIRFDGHQSLKEGDIIHSNTCKSDFLRLIAFEDDDARLTFNGSIVKIGHEPVLVYLRGLPYCEIQLINSDFGLDAYSFTDQHFARTVDNLIFRTRINQVMNKTLMYYDRGRFMMSWTKATESEYNPLEDVGVKVGLLKRGKVSIVAPKRDQWADDDQ